MSAISVSLEQAPLNESVVIADVSQDPGVAHRLMTMGWHPGGRVRLVKRASGGVKVIDLNGSRVAISKDLARTLLVKVLT